MAATFPCTHTNQLTPCSKQEEVAILRETAKRLGNNSYTGAWLNEQLAHIELAIKSDFPPDTYALSVEQASAEAERIRKDAKEELDNARQRSQAIIEEARGRANEIIRQTHCDIRNTVRKLLDNL